MAIEYRLPYTAQEINERLRKTDDIEHKQDKLTFDSEPTEGSENLVKSGDIYTAIQNATPNLTFDEAPTEGSENLVKSGAIYNALQDVGGTDLVAGDLIEIKDGVIRSTLGDLLSDETEEIRVEFYHADNIEMGDQGDGTYSCGGYVELTNPIDTNEKLTIKFELPNSTIKTFDVDIIVTDYDEEEGVTYFGGIYNLIITDDGMVKVDENLDAFYFEGAMTDETFEMAYITFEDYTGASITISQSKVVEHKVYATLPDNALTAGNLIKIENGVVSSTLGTEIVSIKESEFLNIDSVPSDCYDNDSGQTMYRGECDYVPTIGDKVDVEITLANSDDSISFNDVEVKAYGEASWILTNSDQTVEDFDNNGIIKKDENLPSIFCSWIEEEGVGYYAILSFDDLTGASIKINGIATNVKVVKLPNEALTFDEEPTEDSKNLVDSGSVYNAINNVKSSFVYDSTPTQGSQNLMKSGDIYNAFKESFVYDSTPTQGSQNLMKSGDIYNAFEESEEKVPTTIVNFIGSNVLEKVEANHIEVNDNITIPVTEYGSVEGSPIVQTTFRAENTTSICGQNLLVPNTWYKLVYDGVEYIALCEYGGGVNAAILRFPGTPGDFHIDQYNNNQHNNMAKSDHEEHNVILYKLKPSMTDLTNYLNSLCSRIQKLEAQLNNN